MNEIASEPLSSVGSGMNFSYPLSVSKGFNFKNVSQERVGYFNYLKIGDTVLSADLSLADPTNPVANIKVTGVLSAFSWEGGNWDPVHLSAQVSVANKQVLAPLMSMNLASQKVEFQFTVYAYDQASNTYYKALYDGRTLDGKVQISGGSQVFTVNVDASTEVRSPENYALTIGIMPQSIAQTIIAASSAGQSLMRWGVAII